MAAAYDEPPILRCDSPSPDNPPAQALGPPKDSSRHLSTSSYASHGSYTDGSTRESLGSNFSRHSSASFGSRRSDVSFGSSRMSTGSFDQRQPRRRGFVRPQGTDFAASARARDSVLSLGSIAHLQYYFARTGLLEGKGGQLARKRNTRATLDLSQLDTNSFLSAPKPSGSDADSSYASLGSSPDLGPQPFGGGQLVESPIDEQDYSSDDEFQVDPSVLPPTTSTYNHREKPLPKPPSNFELKTDLIQTLNDAAKVLNETKTTPVDPSEQHIIEVRQSPSHSAKKSVGWFEVEGMHILDVITLAIRAAKMYYTSHDHPDRLDAIKPEKQVRAELLSVMEVLKHMATRSFAGGMRDYERDTMSIWVASVQDLLRKEEEIEELERAERARWPWLSGDWNGKEIEREISFLETMDIGAEPLPAYTPVSVSGELPTPFLKSFQNGLRLVKLHNAAVGKSRRRYGAIPTFHTDTEKPYRCAENLRYWIKAAELRFEVMLKVDVLSVVYNKSPEAWVEFEQALWKWCSKVREEITSDLEQ